MEIYQPGEKQTRENFLPIRSLFLSQESSGHNQVPSSLIKTQSQMDHSVEHINNFKNLTANWAAIYKEFPAIHEYRIQSIRMLTRNQKVKYLLIESFKVKMKIIYER